MDVPSNNVFKTISFHQLYGIEDGLFFGLIAVFIDIDDVARAVGDTHRTIKAAPDFDTF